MFVSIVHLNTLYSPIWAIPMRNEPCSERWGNNISLVRTIVNQLNMLMEPETA